VRLRAPTPRLPSNRMSAMRSENTSDAAHVELNQVLEALHAQQSQLDAVVATLDARSRDFDTSLETAIFRALMAPSGERAAALSQMHRAIAVRFAKWSFSVVSVCALAPAALSWILMPSRAQLLEARQTRDQLAAGVAELTQKGGRVELTHCGTTNRLCVRVDRKSPFYGPTADYIVVKGY
jgi:hypothetical protein